MNKFDFSKVSISSHIHFIGVGGISMSALASILLKKGYKVTGSDTSDSKYIKALRNMGAGIFIGHAKENAIGSDVVVYSSAIKADNPERAYAEENNIPCIERSVLLGSIEKMYKYPVDVAGTHGKTSTTGMLSHIFIAADKNPTILIGGELPVINGNMHIGGDEYFISESCEYHCSFLDFSPYISVILNVDADHLDYFKDIEEIKQAFGKFASIASGAVVINADDKNTVDAVGSIEKPIITTSAKAEADFYAKNISCNGFSEYSFDVYGQSGYINHIELSVPGVHHVNNALCAYAAAATLGVDAESIAKGLKSFTGVKRRFELKCEQNGIRIYDDYAHHPTEIAATLQTLKNFTANERYIIFQPHTYTRTYALLGDFIKALSGVGTIIVLPIYAAREKDTGKISGKDIAEKIEGAYYAESFEDAADYILPRLKKGDIVMTMGAGDVYKTGDILINKIKNC